MSIGNSKLGEVTMRTLWDTFVEAVGKEFHFLETDFGFARKSAKPPNVIYESDKLQVQIYYDTDGRHELDLALRRLSDNSQKPLSLGIDLLTRLNEGLNTSGYTPVFPSSEEALERGVKHVAQLLKRQGSDVLSGDLAVFQRLEHLERELAKKFGPNPPT